MLTHDLLGDGDGFGPHVEKRTHALALKNDAAAVVVGFDPVIHARRGKDGFQAQGVFQAFGDVDQFRAAVAEVVGVTFRPPDLGEIKMTRV